MQPFRAEDELLHQPLGAALSWDKGKKSVRTNKLVTLLLLRLTLPSLSQLSHHVLGEQKQSGDGDVSDIGPKPPGQEQPEVAGGRRRELRGTASPPGHLGEPRHAEAPAVPGTPRRAVRHPRRGLGARSTGGRVRTLQLSRSTDYGSLEAKDELCLQLLQGE